MAGRKPLREKKKIKITAQIEPEAKEHLNVLSRKTNTTASKLVSEAVDDMIAKYNDKGVYSIIRGKTDKEREKMLEQDGKNHAGVSVVVANHKGGVAKTTTVSSIAVIAGQDDKKVLMVDMDRQCNLSELFGYGDEWEGNTVGHYLFDCIQRVKKSQIKFDDIADYIQPTDYKNVDIIVGSDELDDNFSVSLSQANNSLGGKSVLSLMIRDIKRLNIYDYIIFDSNPSLNSFVLDAISACDWTVTTTDLDPFGFKGIEKIDDFISMNQELENKVSKHAGALFTRSDSRTAVAKSIEGFKETFVDRGVNIFRTVIPTSSQVSKTRFGGVPVVAQYPVDKVTKKYREFYRELVNLIG